MKKSCHRVRYVVGEFCAVGMCALTISGLVNVHNVEDSQMPTRNNVTISNGDLSLTFNIAWGGVVVAVDNSG